MPKLLPVFLGSLLGLIVYAQESAPPVRTLSSEFERIELVRLRAGTDLLEGLKVAIEERHIRNGVILSGIGSVTDYHYHVVSDKNLPPAEEDPQASVPMDLTSVQGYILGGRIHAHMTLADENSVVGGHVEPGTKALTFMIFTIGVLPESLDLGSLDDYRL
jgi:predicted DNA-binding protein with PD1-like motif